MKPENSSSFIDNKTDRELIEERLKTLRPIDNDVFACFASNIEFCQEFLRVVLEDNELKVIECDAQKYLPNAYFKSSQIDMLTKLSDGRLVNVEVQLYDESHTESAKRIFHYASMIRQSFVEKGEKYQNIDDIIIIYLTEKDIFKKNCTKYHVSMSVSTDSDVYVEKWDCGLEVYYVNTIGTSNKIINKYLKMFIDRTTYEKKYPKTTEIKEDFTQVRGGRVMSEWFNDLLDKREQKGIQQVIISLVKDGTITIKKAAETLKVSETEISKMMLA